MQLSDSEKQQAVTSSGLPDLDSRSLLLSLLLVSSPVQQLPALAWFCRDNIRCSGFDSIAKEQLAQRQLAIIIQWGIIRGNWFGQCATS